MEMKLEGLEVVHNGSSGIEIRVKLSEKYNCGEFTLNDKPQPVFISPWMQFEPSAMNDERLQIANEIARRAINYDDLLKKTEKLIARRQRDLEAYDMLRETLNKAYDLWREERKKLGLPEDFSDIKTWPKELLGDYGYEIKDRQEARIRVLAPEFLKALRDIAEESPDLGARQCAREAIDKAEMTEFKPKAK